MVPNSILVLWLAEGISSFSSSSLASDNIIEEGVVTVVVLEVFDVLKMVVLDIIDEGLKGVEITLLRAICCSDDVEEGVLVIEAELIIDSNDIVQFATNCKVIEGGERIHD
ncbi:hypothetical protein MRB53_033297 [Persea americana]|uniref:Uncharacterized protein n=1 Tax=Persea americana TaxID=3435 RepID=A0ACC2KVB4_PERAE|nr:hypothetical protein MRB53_033297 [Persea americana]